MTKKGLQLNKSYLIPLLAGKGRRRNFWFFFFFYPSLHSPNRFS
ncbi:hypothetical protein NC652_017383 [Populus alba x Populus x berolinensis]|nr:hypothetical protein NC652_017383 [Populus alba x Populus x berolinensis]